MVKEEVLCIFEHVDYMGCLERDRKWVWMCVQSGRARREEYFVSVFPFYLETDMITMASASGCSGVVIARVCLDGPMSNI